MKMFKVFKKKCGFLGRAFLFFGRNSGVHGLKYVVEENGTKFSRTIWLFVILSFTGCMYLLLMPVIQRGKAVSFTPDTRYLYWNTTFPAVTVCETYSPKLVLRKLLEKYPDLFVPLNYDYKRYVADLIFGGGICIRSLCMPCGTTIPCDVPWRDIIENTHKKCNEMITDCRFNGKEFSCCKHFGIVDSEYGTCYSFNSLQTRNIEDTTFMVNRSTGPGLLTLSLSSDAQVSIQSSEELATNFLDKKFKFLVKTNAENIVDIFFTTIEVDNEQILQDEDISVRRCRYNYEIPKEPLHTYKVYSYGACRLARNTHHFFQHCGCVHPVRDPSYNDIYCNYTGLNCLVTYEALKTKLGIKDDTYSDDCLPSCDESELSIIHVTKRWVEEQKSGTVVNIRMASLPTLRYQKTLLRTDLDLVVTVGGIVGLFFSASILSFAEIFYLIFRPPNK